MNICCQFEDLRTSITEVIIGEANLPPPPILRDPKTPPKIGLKDGRRRFCWNGLMGKEGTPPKLTLKSVYPVGGFCVSRRGVLLWQQFFYF